MKVAINNAFRMKLQFTHQILNVKDLNQTSFLRVFIEFDDIMCKCKVPYL